MTPAELAAWEADADDWTADVDRLRADLDAHPDSPTLNRLALRDHSGRVVGYSLGTDALALAWAHGAPAALVVDAERLAAAIGPRGSVGYLRRAVRLSHRVHAVNAALRRYSGAARSLPTVTVLAPVDYLAAVAADVDAASLTTPTGSPLAHAPPSLPAPSLTPLRGPPRCSLVRPSTSSPARPHSTTERLRAVSRVT